MWKYVAIVVSTALSAVAQYMLKRGVSKPAFSANLSERNFAGLLKFLGTDLTFISGFLLYIGSAVVWLYVLSKFELSKAYPFASLGYVFTMLLGFFLLGEDLNPVRIGAIVLIIAGVSLLSFS